MTHTAETDAMRNAIMETSTICWLTPSGIALDNGRGTVIIPATWESVRAWLARQ